MHKLCTHCAQAVHRLCAIALLAAVMACAPQPVEDTRLLRNPTAPIGAITRFDAAQFDGTWQVQRSAGGDWALARFVVSDRSTQWREGAGRSGRLQALGPGILRLSYADGKQRDVWVLWIDPDHQTAALGDPEGRFGFVATRAGTARADQIRAAEQVLDFNGYRTETWDKT